MEDTGSEARDLSWILKDVAVDVVDGNYQDPNDVENYQDPNDVENTLDSIAVENGSNNKGFIF